MLLIYSYQQSPRLRYIAKQIFERILGIPISVTLKIEDFVAYSGPKFSYGKQPLGNELFIQSTNLLFEQGVNEDIISIKDWNGLPCFYKSTHPESAVPFDVLAASFYMLTRYEEYLPQVKDSLGRFMAKSSLAHQHGFLQMPVVDLWALRIKQVLNTRFNGIEWESKNFHVELICEVNEAFAYQKKGWFRTLEGVASDLWKLKFGKIVNRAKVILGIMKDPYHTYNYMINKARKSKANLRVFFGLGNYSSHEKSINANSYTYQKLIKSIADYCPIGLRLSYDSQKNIAEFKTERKRFEQITHRPASHTFCQYAKISLPNTYRTLIEQEVTADYSMGYQDYAGFRAGTCTPFLFYDLDYEIQTPLLVVPFCLSKNMFVNITSHEKGMEQASQLINSVKQVNGKAVIHIQNDMFDVTDSRASFWKAMYTYFLSIG